MTEPVAQAGCDHHEAAQHEQVNDDHQCHFVQACPELLGERGQCDGHGQAGNLDQEVPGRDGQEHSAIRPCL